jgi:hypothetical protein
MAELIYDSITQARVEGRKPRFTAAMVKWIMEVCAKE